MSATHLQIEPCSVDAVLMLERELGVSFTLAQVLVRRGLSDVASARDFLDAATSHDPAQFGGIERAAQMILGHVAKGSVITIHGDYDVDGVCSTAVLVRALRRLGARVDSYLPDRVDGYGLSMQTVGRLAARGTRLLITVDCAITAVDEVAAATAAGMDVVVTDHHAPRPDGVLPDAPLVHPVISGYPCPDLCATAVAYKLAQMLHRVAGVDAGHAEEDLDLVALATIADVVALTGENRTLVRRGLRALATTAKPGLQALMAVARINQGRVDERAVAFGLCPRLNAAGRLYRADASLELLMTEDVERAREIADELDHANHERRHVETRILFEAEAQVARLGERCAYVLWSEDWHPGVIGIVASRIAERHHRPVVLVALDGAGGRGSGRSIHGFDLLAALSACGEHLSSFGGHRAAAGLQIERASLDVFAQAFSEHADSVLSAADLVPVERVDAVVGGDDLGMALAEELTRLAPFGRSNPSVSLLVAAATLSDARPMGEGRHVRFNVEAGGARARAVGFGTGGQLPVAQGSPADVVFTLEVNEYNGTVEPRLVLRHAQECSAAAISVAGEPDCFMDAVWAELEAVTAGEQSDPPPSPEGLRAVRDRRGRSVAGSLRSLAETGEPLLVVCADAERRSEHLAGRLGGLTLCSYEALARDPGLAARADHLALLDPPASAAADATVRAGTQRQHVHLLWGEPEVRFAARISERDNDLRGPLTELYRSLRAAGSVSGEELASLLRTGDARPSAPTRVRPAALAGRLLRVLSELELIEVDRARAAVSVRPAQATDLERSPTFRAHADRLAEGRRMLGTAAARAA